MLPDPASPEDWLRHARSDLVLATEGHGLRRVLLETLCFHAQQCAEKSLKGILIHHGVPFPFSHDIARLISLVRQAGIPWNDDLDDAAALTYFAVHARYPGPIMEIDEEAWEEAVDTARRVLDWAREQLAPGTDSANDPQHHH